MNYYHGTCPVRTNNHQLVFHQCTPQRPINPLSCTRKMNQTDKQTQRRKVPEIHTKKYAKRYKKGGKLRAHRGRTHVVKQRLTHTLSDTHTLTHSATHNPAPPSHPPTYMCRGSLLGDAPHVSDVLSPGGIIPQVFTVDHSL
eukprot:GHVU01181957.1.p1 GENE.GHVU01181957.1~~GHVU01181957.1.p1  ORF type:complete len:142 (+),score=5.31 GHVU01181957.1:137-562(+)